MTARERYLSTGDVKVALQVFSILFTQGQARKRMCGRTGIQLDFNTTIELRGATLAMFGE